MDDTPNNIQLVSSGPSFKNDGKKNRVAYAVRRKHIKIILWGSGAAIILSGLILGSIKYSRWYTKNLPGQFFENQGQEHVELDYTFTYNSNPPSSGPHFGKPANWRIYAYEVNDKIFIHNLEHGGVWIAYRPTISPSIIDDLKSIINEFNGSKIVMAPRSSNDTDIAVVAWSRVLKFNLAESTLSDKEKNEIRGFYRAFKNHGPEFVPDIMPGIDPKTMR